MGQNWTFRGDKYSDLPQKVVNIEKSKILRAMEPIPAVRGHVSWSGPIDIENFHLVVSPVVKVWRFPACARRAWFFNRHGQKKGG